MTMTTWAAPNNEPLVTHARLFAAAAHGAIGQVRKYSLTPYIEHPERVARLVRVAAHGSQAMIAAAWLHDVVEDTKITQEDINYHFPPEVSALVDWMTDKTTLSDGNRATRKAMERERWKSAPPAAQTIKLADCYDNAKDIFQHDKDFSVVYIREIGLLLPSLDHGNETLRNMLRRVLDEQGFG